MSVPYGLVPQNANVKPSKFTLAVPESELHDFKALLKLSKVGPVTYEGVQQDRKYGITQEWLKTAKEHWENTFDWWVPTLLIWDGISLTLFQALS